MMIRTVPNASAIPVVSDDPDDPVALIERLIQAAEQRRDEQLAYIETLDPQGQARVFSRPVLEEIETTLKRSREHLDFVRDMLDGGENGGHGMG